MKTQTRVIDYTAPQNGAADKELPMVLVCIQRALLLAAVPGIRCTNKASGEQFFETAGDTPVHVFMNHIMQKARAGESIPSPREALALFGQCCHSPLPCGAPVACDNAAALLQKTKAGV